MNEDRKPILRGVIRLLLNLIFILLPVASIPMHPVMGQGGETLFDTFYQSAAPDRPPVIDGVISPGEWDKAQSLPFEHGVLFFQNDAVNLYLLFDQTDVLQSQSSSADAKGSLVLASDAHADGEPSGGADLLLSFSFPDQAACRQLFSSSRSLSACSTADSSAAMGFGPSNLSSTPHRVWEAAISLAEIGALPTGIVHLGLKTASSRPETDETYPANFPASTDQFLQIRLARQDAKLLVLSHEDFITALQPLAAYKDATGIPTYIQSWQSLDKAFHNEGRDQPERIKLAIAAYARYAGTSYVMLVGDAAHFPVRYTLTDRADEKSNSTWIFSSADYYYADLFKPGGAAINTWDANNDGYFGELHGGRVTGVMNVDQVGTVPEVAIGRLPVANAEQVKLYIDKIEAYEKDAYQADWSKRAVFIATTDWVESACYTAEGIISGSLEPNGYTVTRLYQPGNPCLITVSPAPSVITNNFNEGAGFINYLGHGEATAWQLPSGWYETRDLDNLTQTSRLPIVFSAGCNTARDALLPPYDSYIDVQGVFHPAITTDDIASTQKSPQPAPLQEGGDLPDSMAKELVVENKTGAVAYIGGDMTTQYPSYEMDALFYDSLNHGAVTLGDMWKYMVTRFYQIHPALAKIDQPNWYLVAIFQQPWKFELYGDPSLRIQGIPGN